VKIKIYKFNLKCFMGMGLDRAHGGKNLKRGNHPYLLAACISLINQQIVPNHR
jgi:hypothetical protein